MLERRAHIWRGWAWLCALALAGLLCGPVLAKTASPQQAVVKWIKDRLEHPETYQGLKWSKVVNHPYGPYKYSIRHVYRVRNNLNTRLICDVIFSFDQEGRIVSTDVVEPDMEPQKTRWRP